jgi:hypothetical protein
MPPSLNFPQLDFVKPSSGFHPVTWERVSHQLTEVGPIHFEEDFQLFGGG